MHVKICGITNIEDAILSHELGADFLGFNFYKKSKRYISPKIASQIIDSLPKNYQTVGIFVNHCADEINSIVKLTKIKFIQLHGNETLDFALQFKVPVIKRITEQEFKCNTLDDYKKLFAVLIDAIDPNYGGSGKVADWKFAYQVAKELPLFLAGGITKDNILFASDLIKPYALDICSGLEEYPGKKSPVKISQLFKILRVSGHDS